MVKTHHGRTQRCKKIQVADAKVEKKVLAAIKIWSLTPEELDQDLLHTFLLTKQILEVPLLPNSKFHSLNHLKHDTWG